MMIQYIIVNLILPVVKPSCEIFAAFFHFFGIGVAEGCFFMPKALAFPSLGKPGLICLSAHSSSGNTIGFCPRTLSVSFALRQKSMYACL